MLTVTAIVMCNGVETVLDPIILTLSDGAPTILLEDGDAFLLEDGDSTLLEAV